MTVPPIESLSLYHFFPGKEQEAAASPLADAPAEAASWRTVAGNASGPVGCLVTLPAAPAVLTALADAVDVHVECVLPVDAPLDGDAVAALARTVLDTVGRGAPVHVIAASDDLDVSVLEAVHKALGKAGILYAYIRGVPGHAAQNTYCHDCRAMIVERDGDRVVSQRMLMGKCPFCYVNIPGRWADDPRMAR